MCSARVSEIGGCDSSSNMTSIKDVKGWWLVILILSLVLALVVVVSVVSLLKLIVILVSIIGAMRIRVIGVIGISINRSVI